MDFAKLSVTVFLILPIFLAVLVNGDFLGSIRKLWAPTSSASSSNNNQSEQDVGSGKSFSSRAYYDQGGGGGGSGPPGGDPYMMSAASQRGWGWGGGGGGGGGGWGGHDDHQNLDLYSLLGGLSFASLLGATIIYLARRNTSGRRRRSADGLSYLEDDEVDFSEDPSTKGLNIVELLDTFLDNRQIFFGDDYHTDDESYHSNHSSSSSSNTSSNRMTQQQQQRPHLGPGIVPHTLSDPVY